MKGYLWGLTQDISPMRLSWRMTHTTTTIYLLKQYCRVLGIASFTSRLVSDVGDAQYLTQTQTCCQKPLLKGFAHKEAFAQKRLLK
eukprot:scaffold334946_cov15-Prasinocladus_malaysianus.AAC.1